MKRVKRGLAMLLGIAMVFSLMTGVGAPKVSAADYALTMKSVKLIPFYKNINSSPNNTTYDDADFLAVPISAETSASSDIETGYYVRAYVTWYNTPDAYSGVNYTYDEVTWTLGTEGIVEISWDFADYIIYGSSYGIADIKLNPISTGTTTLTWKCGEFEDSITIRVVDTLATGLTISPTTVTLTSEGQQQQLTPTLTPSGADDSMVYTSKNESVATVSATGVITAVSSGTCYVYATATGGNGLETSCKVTVQLAGDASPVYLYSGITFPASWSLEVGHTDYMPYQYFYTDIDKINQATGIDFFYESSDETVATADSNGLITAVSEGEATLTMTPANTSASRCLTDTYTVNVTVTEATTAEVPVTSVAISQTSASLKAGEYVNLSASVSPEDASDKSITWSSSDESVAVLNGSQVCALKAGTAVITATAASGVSATCTVTVEDDTILVTSVSVTPVVLSLAKGETYALSATVLPSDAADSSVTWSSTKTSVATVNSDGTVTAVASGTASIIATAADGSGMAGSCTVTVTTPVTSLTFSESGGGISEG